MSELNIGSLELKLSIDYATNKQLVDRLGFEATRWEVFAECIKRSLFIRRSRDDPRSGHRHEYNNSYVQWHCRSLGIPLKPEIIDEHTPVAPLSFTRTLVEGMEKYRQHMNTFDFQQTQQKEETKRFAFGNRLFITERFRSKFTKTTTNNGDTPQIISSSGNTTECVTLSPVEPEKKRTKMLFRVFPEARKR